MSWQHLVYVGFSIVGALGYIYQIGKPRDTLTPGLVTAVIALQGFFVWLVLTG